jgi:hypothetical protein
MKILSTKTGFSPSFAKSGGMKPAPTMKAWAGLNVIIVESSTYPKGVVNLPGVWGKVTKM